MELLGISTSSNRLSGDAIEASIPAVIPSKISLPLILCILSSSSDSPASAGPPPVFRAEKILSLICGLYLLKASDHFSETSSFVLIVPKDSFRVLAISSQIRFFSSKVSEEENFRRVLTYFLQLNQQELKCPQW